MSLPRVTEIIKAAGLMSTVNYTDFARDRGSAVHLATRYFDEGTLDEASLDPQVVPRFNAYRAFVAEVKPEILAIEEEVVNHMLGYVGHLDRRLVINGEEGVLDIKPPTAENWHALQLALYAICFPRPMARWNLYLKDNGRYQLEPRRDRGDISAAHALVTLHNWKLNKE